MKRVKLVITRWQAFSLKDVDVAVVRVTSPGRSSATSFKGDMC
jgi:hypothetical protein